MRKRKNTISIPEELYNAIKERVNDTEFKSVEEYVTFVLEEVIKDNEDQDDMTFTMEDDEEVKAKLRALGYMD